jgi:long-chain-fatty-acid--CoA ligase ACSBG
MEYGKAQDSSVDILCSAFGVSSSGSDVPRDASEFPQPWGYSLASSLVFQKVREAIGLDQCKNCFVSAAPISLETLKFFAALDIQIFEIFGQSECTGPHTVSSRGFWKMGTCGRPLPGTETKLNVGNGELCYRGRHIFMGYMYMPAQTAETIDDDGWLHSGDVAELDADGRDDQPGLSGFMRITGRIKELLVTAGGENVPPVLIENEVKTALSAVSNCVVLGDKKKFLSMLVSLKVEMDKETGAPTDQLAAEALYISKQIGSPATTLSAAAQDPLWSKYIEDGVKTANKKAFSNAQTIQKFRFLPADFSEKTGELTPTMKLKRKVVNEKYAAIIEEMYRGEETN